MITCQAPGAVSVPCGAVVFETDIAHGTSLGACAASIAIFICTELAVGNKELSEKFPEQICLSARQCSLVNVGNSEPAAYAFGNMPYARTAILQFSFSKAIAVNVKAGQTNIGVWHRNGKHALGEKPVVRKTSAAFPASSPHVITA